MNAIPATRTPGATATAFPQRPLSTREAAEYLGKGERTLIRWRVERVGPPWTYCGREVRYLPEDLNAWLRARRVVPVAEETEAGK